MRLVGMVLDYWWEIDGFAVSRGMPPLASLPLDRLCSFARWWATRESDDAGKNSFEAKLWRPVIGSREPAQGPWSPQRETDSLRSLKAMLGGRPTSGA